MTKETKRTLRAQIFQHLDGLVTAPAAIVLKDKGVLDYLLQHNQSKLSAIALHFKANEGYLNVALRTLACQGFLDYSVSNKSNEVLISLNAISKKAFEAFEMYRPVVDLIKLSGDFHPKKFNRVPFLKFMAIGNKLIKKLAHFDSLSALERQIVRHVEGVLIAPTIVILGMNKMFHKYFTSTAFAPEEFHNDQQSFTELLEFFTQLGWFQREKELFKFTEKGLFFAKRAAAYGVTVSYTPILRTLEELIFSNPTFLNAPVSQVEKHVDRAMNVWGSGGAHSTYFKKIDEIIVEIFNQDLEKQPKGILDMGCGDGTFLIHLFNLIEGHTLRGKHLDEYPLLLVGADYNQTAINISKRNILENDIWAKVIWGDIGNPELLDDTLKKNYEVPLRELLNVRSFLDHNRPWFDTTLSNGTFSISQGAFCHKGKRLDNSLVFENLKVHLQKWMPFIDKHGLLLLELHGNNPNLIKDNIGLSAATAYEATHGYSDQYILEIDEFNRAITEIGLNNQNKHYSKFPSNELASVSINYIIKE